MRNDTVDMKLGIVQKYGWKGVVILVLSTIAPYLWSMYDNYMTKKNTDLIEKVLKNETTMLYMKIEAIRKVLEQNLKIAVESHGKKSLKSKVIIDIARDSVGVQSFFKVEQIRQYLHTSRHDSKKIKRRRIKHILITNTKIYVKKLNQFTHYKVGLIGDYIWNEFPMNTFLVEVYAILEDESITIDKRCENLQSYMIMTAQDQFFKDMKKKMD